MPLATTQDTVRLQEAITKIAFVSNQLLSTSQYLIDEMRKVDDHNISAVAHPDIRTDISKLQPNWDTDGNYQGPVGVGYRDDMVVGIEFLSEDDVIEVVPE